MRDLIHLHADTCKRSITGMIACLSIIDNKISEPYGETALTALQSIEELADGMADMDSPKLDAFLLDVRGTLVSATRGEAAYCGTDEMYIVSSSVPPMAFRSSAIKHFRQPSEVAGGKYVDVHTYCLLPGSYLVQVEYRFDI